MRDVVFRGLTFAAADWTMDPKGYADTQAATPAPAAIEAVGAVGFKIRKMHHCTLRRLRTFSGTGVKHRPGVSKRTLRPRRRWNQSGRASTQGERR